MIFLFKTLALGLLVVACGAWPQQQVLGESHAVSGSRGKTDLIKHGETREEAVKNVKHLIHNVTMGHLASIFPDTHTVTPGYPFVFPEYHAPCHPDPSTSHSLDLVFLLMPISRTSQNIMLDPEHRVTYTVQHRFRHGDEDGKGRGHGGGRGKRGGKKSLMDYARVAFTGTMHRLNITEPLTTHPHLTPLEQCYTAYHPDSKSWLPSQPDRAHESFWAKLEVENVWYVGGFGDLHYIGNLPLDLFEQT